MPLGQRLASMPAAATLAPVPVRWRSPVVGVQLVAAIAWVGFAAMLATTRASAASAQPTTWWCMPGMTLGRTASSDPLAAALAGAPMWTLMALAMTLPAAIPVAQHVAINSFRRRQWRAVAEFLAVYLGLWLAFGLLAMTGFALLYSTSQSLLLAACLILAAAWELTPLKRLALNRCHRSSPLPPRGWRASAGVARFGLMHGSACIASCWGAMLVMLTVPSGRLAWSAALTVVTAWEKLTRRPRRAARFTAAIFAGAAVGVVVSLLLE
jgi:predicted metal-binding membrane protein